MRYLCILFCFIFAGATGHTQVYYVLFPIDLAKAAMPEHGFLPGKKFQFYPTIGKYDFAGQKLRIELYDRRDSLQLTKIDCAEITLTNEAGFSGETGAQTILRYWQSLCPQSGILIDSAAADTLKVYLDALDARLLGFGSITAHGLCKMDMQLHGQLASYCTDITDKSPHSPIGRNALVSRKTATRVILSAAIRETIELFFMDVKAGKFQHG